jgi:AraC-like DNA-binding protein
MDPGNTSSMAIYMDLHIVPGVNAKDVADAHSMDVLMEKEHSCKCLTYWIDELRGYVFCLIDAPDKESVIELHTRAHGLVPNKIIEVEPSLVHAFLGRITDPENAYVTDGGLMILDDTSYRVVMHLQTEDFVLLEEKLGSVKASELMQSFKSMARGEILRKNGREVSTEGNEVVASFVEGEKAFAAAVSISGGLTGESALDLRIGLHAGEPVMQSDRLFGDTVQMLQRLNTFGRGKPLVMTQSIRELLGDDAVLAQKSALDILSPRDESFVASLFDAIETGFSEEDFDMDACCRRIAVSESQLYRNTTRIFSLSPNNLLRGYRLLRAKDMLRTTDLSVSQVGFDTGFSSSSYFTKCFKSQYGLLPLAYRELCRRKRD